MCVSVNRRTCFSIIARGCCANTYEDLKLGNLKPLHITQLQPGILPKVLSRIRPAATSPAHIRHDGPTLGSDEQLAGATVCFGGGCLAVWAALLMCSLGGRVRQALLACSPCQCCVSAFSKTKGSQEAACLHKQLWLLWLLEGDRLTTSVPASLKFNSYWVKLFLYNPEDVV